jgi:exodeoxyribonuclease VIII
MEERIGIYENLPEQDYHSDSALGSTDLKILSKSVQEFRYKKDNPEEETKESLKIGKIFHALVSDGIEEVYKNYAILPGKEEMKIGSSFYEKIKNSADFEENFELPKSKNATQFKYIGNKETIKESDFEEINLWYEKLKANHAAAEILNHKQLKKEVSYFWREDGIRFKCRFDLLVNNQIIVDIKTVANIYMEEYNKLVNGVIANYKYHVQAKHYLNGLNHFRKESGLEENSIFAFLFVEKSAPYRIARKILPQTILDCGQYDIDKGIANYKHAINSNNWIDDISENIILAEMPGYFLNEYQMFNEI